LHLPLKLVFRLRGLFWDTGKGDWFSHGNRGKRDSNLQTGEDSGICKLLGLILTTASYPAFRVQSFLAQELLFIGKDNESYILAMGHSAGLAEPQKTLVLKAQKITVSVKTLCI
jgi:hypothetical protein